MTTQPVITTVTDARTGEKWGVVSVTRTSDGFLMGTAYLLNVETGDVLEDGDGYPIVETLFLGRVN